MAISSLAQGKCLGIKVNASNDALQLNELRVGRKGFNFFANPVT
jgi:hypothetical protein